MIKHRQYFRMAYQNTNETIECEYVYEQDKVVPNPEASIFEGQYSDGDSDSDKYGKDPPANPKSTNNTNSGTSKKKRTSRYDEDFYALPDLDEESEIQSVKSKLKAKEIKLLSKERKLRAWRLTSFVSICIILVSLTGNVYLAVRPCKLKGKLI